jgi:hypothetical protein
MGVPLFLVASEAVVGLQDVKEKHCRGPSPYQG